MDLDTYVAGHAAEWDRLERLTHQRARLTGAEADEVIELYQRTATHLSVIRSTAADPVLEARLSGLVAGARGAITGAGVPAFATIAAFVTTTVPAALYRCRWWWLVTSTLAVLVSVLIAVRVVDQPGLAGAIADPAQIKQLVDHDFAAYYSENPASDFAFSIWLNNARVAALALITGVVLFPVVIVLWSNQANLGVVAGLMIGAGRGDLFFGLILPHGLLELSIVYLAAAGGLRVGWAWIAPGRRTRSRALAEEGRAAGAMALGLALWLGLSGLVEAFVTPSTLPTGARIAIGAAVWLAFLTYVLVLGRRAARSGAAGDLDPAVLEATAPAEAA